MVKGLDLFRVSFSAYQGRYVPIGGTASTLVLEEAGLPFRATKDLDIVLCVEAFIVLSELSIVGPDRLIPLKARAWLDLRKRRDAGERIDERDVRKHRNDIIRLYNVLDPATAVAAPDSIRADLRQFLSRLPGESGLDLPALGFRSTTIEEIVRRLSGVYQL